MTLRRSRPVGVAIALTMLGAACIGGGPGDVSFLSLSSITGTGTWRATAADPWTGVVPGTKLGRGARLRVAPGSVATLARGRASTLEIRPYDSVTPAELVVLAPERVSVAAGDVLVVNGREAPIAVESEGVSASGRQGTFRFDRRLSVRIGVYEGSAVISSPAGEMNVPTLREAGLLRRQLPRAPRPLTIRPGDPWDARLLADVIALDRELQTQKQGAAAEFGNLTAAQLRPVAGDTDVSFVDDPRYASLPAGDLLIAVVLAVVAEQDGGERAADVFARAVELYGAGATWGLIARETGLADRLLDSVARAVGLLTGEVRPSTPRRPLAGPPEPRPTSSSPSPRPTRSSKPSPKPSPTPSKSTSPPPSPTPTPTESCGPVDFLLGTCQEPDL